MPITGKDDARTYGEKLPTFALVFRSQWERGAIYALAMNHVIELDEPMHAFRLEIGEGACRA